MHHDGYGDSIRCSCLGQVTKVTCRTADPAVCQLRGMCHFLSLSTSLSLCVCLCLYQICCSCLAGNLCWSIVRYSRPPKGGASFLLRVQLWVSAYVCLLIWWLLLMHLALLLLCCNCHCSCTRIRIPLHSFLVMFVCPKPWQVRKSTAQCWIFPSFGHCAQYCTYRTDRQTDGTTLTRHCCPIEIPCIMLRTCSVNGLHSHTNIAFLLHFLRVVLHNNC